MDELARMLEVRNPLTGRADFTLTLDSADEVRRRARLLRQAQPAWGGLRLEERVALMRKWSDHLETHAASISAADSVDTGHCQISRIAPSLLAATVRSVCAQAPGQYQDAMRDGPSPVMPDVHYETVLQPFGLIGVISPWNGPAYLSLLRAITPLVAGCAVLVKPSEVTPRFVAPVRESLSEIPELAAVFDFVQGDGATGAALIDNVDFVSFTGSVPTGRKVAEACGRRLIPCEVELGGKDPLIVTASADLRHAVAAAVRGAVQGTGQVCFAIERIYVDQSIIDHFVALLVERCEEVTLNYPDPTSGHIGPFIFEAQAEIVDRHIDDAVSKGAKVITGGKSFKLGGGLYMRPTVLTGVDHSMAIMREETFGPVLPVMAYDTVDKAVSLANDTMYGLSAAVIGGDVEEARAIARRINAGNISVQDACLTFVAAAAEADSFGVSGLGGKRSGVQRYLKRKALLINKAQPVCMVHGAGR